MDALPQPELDADRFRLMVESAPNAVIMVDEQGRLAYLNRQTEKLFGYPREELLGQPLERLVPDSVRDRHPELRQAYFRSPSARNMGSGRDLYGQTRDGRRIPVEIGLNPIDTAQGRFVVASIIDISERKANEAALRDNEARIRAIVETAVDCILVIDAVGTIESVNQATERLFGYPAAELLGQNIRMLMPQPDSGRHDSYLSHYLETGQRRVIGIGRETTALRRDGSTFPIELSVSEMSVAGARKFTGIVRDITERRRAEEVLRLQVAETLAALERLQEAQKQLVQSEKMASLGGLVAGVAHEINTPVGVGVTAASHLTDEIARVRAAAANNQLTRSQFQDFLELSQQSSRMILSNLARAVELIQSFKRVAVDQSTDERRSITISEYLKEILLSLRPKLKQLPHRVEVDCPEGLQLRTVPGAWSQIITNLVLNAYSHAFTPERPGRVKISVSQHGQELLLRVEDDGLGIAEDVLPRIFDPFFTTKRGHGGTGLGLNIVYNLVSQTLGGSIEVSSEPGQGTRFNIRLPYQA